MEDARHPSEMTVRTRKPAYHRDVHPADHPTSDAPRGRAGRRGARWRQAPRWLALVVILILGCDIAAAAIIGARVGHQSDGAGSHQARGVPSRSVATPTAPVAPTPKPRPGQAAPTPVDTRDQELAALLQRRATALLARDRVGWLADLDPAATAYRKQQASIFDALDDVPLAVWRYQPEGHAPDVDPATAATRGADAWVARAILSYRIAGFDTADVRREENLTVVRRGERWVIAGDNGAASPGAATRQRDLWELGSLAVARGRYSLILGRTPAKRALTTYAAEVDRAVGAVSRVWGRGWSQKVVVLVPRNQAEMAMVLGTDGQGLDQIAAVTTGQLAQPGATELGTTSSNRVVINPATFTTLGTVGRRVVLAHELTHVATRESTRSAVPIWLSEGFADYVGYRDSGVPVSVAAEDVLDQVRHDNGPTQLPTEPDFDPAHGDVGPAYEGAWLACRLIAERQGEPGLVRFYQVAAGSTGLRDAAATTAAVQVVLGTDQQTLVADWRRYLAQLAQR